MGTNYLIEHNAELIQTSKPNLERKAYDNNLSTVTQINQRNRVGFEPRSSGPKGRLDTTRPTMPHT